MRVIFLDFDGVLNSIMWAEARTAENRGNLYGLDHEAVQRLARLVDAVGAKIVVSSTWRKNRTVERLIELLKDAGYPGDPPVIGKTPVLWRNEKGERLERGHEIQQWLDENPGVESFVILDDDSDMAHLKDRLVRTGNCCGLRDFHFDDVERKFKQ